MLLFTWRDCSDLTREDSGGIVTQCCRVRVWHQSDRQAQHTGHDNWGTDNNWEIAVRCIAADLNTGAGQGEESRTAKQTYKNSTQLWTSSQPPVFTERRRLCCVVGRGYCSPDLPFSLPAPLVSRLCWQRAPVCGFAALSYATKLKIYARIRLPNITYRLPSMTTHFYIKLLLIKRLDSSNFVQI